MPRSPKDYHPLRFSDSIPACTSFSPCVLHVKHLRGILEVCTNLPSKLADKRGAPRPNVDVFCARSVTFHVSEMLTSHRLGSTASQHVSSRRVSNWPTTSVFVVRSAA